MQLGSPVRSGLACVRGSARVGGGHEERMCVTTLWEWVILLTLRVLMLGCFQQNLLSPGISLPCSPSLDFRSSCTLSYSRAVSGGVRVVHDSGGGGWKVNLLTTILSPLAFHTQRRQGRNFGVVRWGHSQEVPGCQWARGRPKGTRCTGTSTLWLHRTGGWWAEL